jgi:endonuclease III related protein
MNLGANAKIRAYYNTLYQAWGPQHWWPARTRFEVIVGAYLTQNTSWKNVEIALRRLRATESLSPARIRTLPLEQLEAMIRPAGYFRQKAARLKTFVAFVDQNYGGSLRRLFAEPTQKLRQELLSLNGVGPRRQIRSCSMPVSIRFLWWMPMPAGLWNATQSPARTQTTKSCVMVLSRP